MKEREGRYNRVKELMQSRMNRVATKIAKDFKNTRPFDKVPVSDEEAIYNYETQGYRMFAELANTQGLEAAVSWQKQMETLKARRLKNA